MTYFPLYQAFHVLLHRHGVLVGNPGVFGDGVAGGLTNVLRKRRVADSIRNDIFDTTTFLPAFSLS